jgi:gliding motility-associated transport system ATP-binding protein
MASVITAEHLTKWYGPRLAVDGVSLVVDRGEIMGLLGPNGSGKTTVLRILAGYLRPSAGTARIAGLDIVTDSLAARRRVGYVPEDAPLYPGMAAREFLDFMGRLKGLTGPGLTAAVDAASQRLALDGVRRTPIGTLSRGYRQRVAIAQALLGDPDLLILDEPTNGLDPRQIIEMRGLIRSLSGDRTILVTSHILGEIEQVADRVAILVQGRLLGVHPLRSPAEGVRLRLRIRGDRPSVLARLRGVPGVRQVEVEDEARAPLVTYLVLAETASVAEPVAVAVTGGGFGLLVLEPAPLELESLFLRLTAAAPERA